MRIRIVSVPVADQAAALRFYTEFLSFEKAVDIPAGDYRWLTVTAPDEPHGAQLLLEPNVHPAAKAYQAALYADGIPVTSFEVGDLSAEFERLSGLGVEFRGPPTDAGGTRLAVFDDTCGNLIQLYESPADG